MSGQNQRGQEDAQTVRPAEFRILGPGPQGKPVAVHFNPESLEYTVTNNIKEQGNSSENKQQISKSSGQLSMELLFDTTLDGSDVRAQTEKLQALMKPVDDGGTKVAPVVEFAWGTYRFRGIFTSYKETLDYFSSTGVPLRASISLSMTQQDGLFDPTAKGKTKIDDREAFKPVANEKDDNTRDRGPVTGDPATDRGLAEDNGEDNPRFFSGKSLTLPGGPNLQPAAAFASGGLSLGASAGIGIGVDVGFSAGVSAGIGIGIGIDAGIDVGLSASFELDIGIDLAFQAQVSSAGVATSVSGFSTGGVAGGAGAAGAAAGAPSGAGIASAAQSPDAGASGDLGVLGAGASAGALGAFRADVGGGEFVRGGPQAPVRARGRGPQATSEIDDTLAELPLGPRFGGAAAAGVPAALGAFAGLRPVPPRRRKAVTLSQLQGARPERQLQTETGASFEVGGRALDRTTSGLAADVGVHASLFDRIVFDDTFE